MHNQLILYNPYYQNDVIEQHLKILIENGEVAFGKIKSALKTTEHNFNDQVHQVYETINEENYMQLFLTDYSSIYVAKVVQVTSFDKSSIAPSYYKDKNLNIEKWFIIKDMREIVSDDFEAVRDGILTNFTTPNYGDHSYALYGNNYSYPLIIEQKTVTNYFDNDNTDFRYYTNMFKSKQYMNIKNNMIQYTFGDKWINFFHPNSLDNIISAEIEYQENCNNPLYDYTSVIIKYSKTMEQELYIFLKKLLIYLISKNSSIQNISYSVQNNQYILSDIFTNKPNLGTMKFILNNKIIKETINNFLNNFNLKIFLKNDFTYYITKLQSIRNESVHGKAPDLTDVQELRKDILGLSKKSMVSELVKNRVTIHEMK